MGYCTATTEPLPHDEMIEEEEDVVVDGWASKCRNNDQCADDEFGMLHMGNCEGMSGFGGCIFRNQFAMCTLEYLPVW